MQRGMYTLRNHAAFMHKHSTCARRYKNERAKSSKIALACLLVSKFWKTKIYVILLLIKNISILQFPLITAQRANITVNNEYGSNEDAQLAEDSCVEAEFSSKRQENSGE